MLLTPHRLSHMTPKALPHSQLLTEHLVCKGSARPWKASLMMVCKGGPTHPSAIPDTPTGNGSVNCNTGTNDMMKIIYYRQIFFKFALGGGASDMSRDTQCAKCHKFVF